MFERNIRFGNIRIEEYTEEGIRVKILRRDRRKQALKEMILLSWTDRRRVYCVFWCGNTEYTISYNFKECIEEAMTTTDIRPYFKKRKS